MTVLACFQTSRKRKDSKARRRLLQIQVLVGRASLRPRKLLVLLQHKTPQETIVRIRGAIPLKAKVTICLEALNQSKASLTSLLSRRAPCSVTRTIVPLALQTQITRVRTYFLQLKITQVKAMVACLVPRIRIRIHFLRIKAHSRRAYSTLLRKVRINHCLK